MTTNNFMSIVGKLQTRGKLASALKNATFEVVVPEVAVMETAVELVLTTLASPETPKDVTAVLLEFQVTRPVTSATMASA